MPALPRIVFDAGFRVRLDGHKHGLVRTRRGKALGGEWAYVENELREVVGEAHRHGALVKVIFETDFLTCDDDKIRLCERCGRPLPENSEICEGRTS